MDEKVFRLDLSQSDFWRSMKLRVVRFSGNDVVFEPYKRRGYDIQVIVSKRNLPNAKVGDVFKIKESFTKECSYE